MPTPSFYRKIGTKMHKYANLLWSLAIVSFGLFAIGLETDINFTEYGYLFLLPIWMISLYILGIIIWFSEDVGKIGKVVEKQYPMIYGAYRRFRGKTAWLYAAWLLLMFLYMVFLMLLTIVGAMVTLGIR